MGKVSRDVLAKQVGESSKQVQRYIRLTELIPELLDMVDNKKLTFTVNQIRMSVHGNRKESVDAFLDGRNHEKYHYFCCSSGSSGNIYNFVLSHCCRKSGREKTDRNHEKRGRTE